MRYEYHEMMKYNENYRYPCSLCEILQRCFLPRMLDFHLASFLGLFCTESGTGGVTNPCSSGPGTLEKKCELFNKPF